MSWLDWYLMYHIIRTDASQEFAKLEGCQMLGHMMGRTCINLIQPDVVYHNSYLGLIGESTITRKSTSQRIGREIFPDVLCHPNESSPEQFIIELENNPRHMCWYGEFSYLLKGVNNSGSYMSRMAEIMNHIFDCPKRYTKTLRDATYTIERPYLSFNTTCTPDMMEHHLSKELLVGGFLPRFLLIEGKAKTKPRGRLDSKYFQYKNMLNKTLMHLKSICSERITFELTDEALERYNEIEQALYKKEKILPFVGRYLNYVISFADILMVSDALGQYMGEPFGNLYKDLLKIDKLDKLVKLVKLDNLISNNISNFTNLTSIPVPEIYINRAYDIIKPCFEYVSKLVDYVDVFQPYAKVKKVIDKHPEIQHSRLMQLTHLPPQQIFQATKMLEDEEYIEIEIIKTPKKKPKNIYRKIV